MISNSVDEVSRNSIWTELIRKEDKLRRDPPPFRPNIKNLKGFALSPNQVNPHELYRLEEEFKSKASDEALEQYEKVKAILMKDDDLDGPSEHDDLPMTESQEVGWMLAHRSEKFRETDERWKAPKNRCDITRFADALMTTATSSGPGR